MKVLRDVASLANAVPSVQPINTVLSGVGLQGMNAGNKEVFGQMMGAYLDHLNSVASKLRVELTRIKEINNVTRHRIQNLMYSSSFFHPDGNLIMNWSTSNVNMPYFNMKNNAARYFVSHLNKLNQKTQNTQIMLKKVGNMHGSILNALAYLE